MAGDGIRFLESQLDYRYSAGNNQNGRKYANPSVIRPGLVYKYCFLASSVFIRQPSGVSAALSFLPHYKIDHIFSKERVL